MTLLPFTPKVQARSNAWILSIAFGFFVVSALSALLYAMRVKAILAFLMPGLICALVLTGGHGGSEADEIIGRLLGFAVNWVAYSALASVALVVWREAHRRVSQRSSKFRREGAG